MRRSLIAISMQKVAEGPGRNHRRPAHNARDPGHCQQATCMVAMGGQQLVRREGPSTRPAWTPFMIGGGTTEAAGKKRRSAF